MKSVFEEMGGTYSDINGYLLPNLAIPESPPLGKSGRMRMRYLKEHRPALYSSLLLTGRLDPHLAEIDEACEERMELLLRGAHGTAHATNGKAGGCDRGAQSCRSDGLGLPHEQHRKPGGRDRDERTRLLLMKV